MAFPTIQTTNVTDNPGSTTNVINMPSGIQEGDLLLVFFGTDGDNEITNWGGFSELDQQWDTRDVFGAVGYKIAVGSDTLTITTSQVEPSSAIMYRIDGWDNTYPPEISTFVYGIDDSPDPAIVTPSWDQGDTLFIAIKVSDANKLISSWPTNYTLSQVEECGGANGDCCVGVAGRNYNNPSDDPGVFTIASADQWFAWTIAVAPVGTTTAYKDITLKTTLESPLTYKDVALKTTLESTLIYKDIALKITLDSLDYKDVSITTSLESALTYKDIALKTTLESLDYKDVTIKTSFSVAPSLAYKDITLKISIESALTYKDIVIQTTLDSRDYKDIALKTTLESALTYKDIALKTTLDSLNYKDVAIKTSLESEAIIDYKDVTIKTSLESTITYKDVALKVSLESILIYKDIALKTTLDTLDYKDIAIKTSLEAILVEPSDIIDLISSITQVKNFIH